MTPHRIGVKLFPTTTPDALDLAPFIPLFHQFIQQSSLPGLLIDVADYAHVPNGPGVILIGHEADYAIDSVGGRTGLLAVRKRCAESPIKETLRDALSKAIHCALAIERDGRTGLQFSAAEIELQFFDRLRTPNDQDTFEALCNEVRPVFASLNGEPTIEWISGDDPRKPASILLRTPGNLDLSTLLATIGG